MGIKIIAEAGVNHNGSIDLAYKLIEKAKESGADYVKFQTFTAKSLVSKNAPKADYQKKLTGEAQTQYEMIKALELDKNTHLKLIEKCKRDGIKFLSTPFDLKSVDLLNDVEIPLYKIPSGEITNLPYLRYIGKIGKPIILSTGMSTLSEVGAALQVLEDAGTDLSQITVLHCNTEYPTPFGDVNLNAMLTIKSELGVDVGYSDHTLGIEVPIAAAALGAIVIEKHFTLDRSLPGPDHKASLVPHELKSMVTGIRNIERALGDGRKIPTISEKKNIPVARKSIVAAKNIKLGDVFSEKNLAVKRPGTGVSPMEWDNYIGKTALRDYIADELID